MTDLNVLFSGKGFELEELSLEVTSKCAARCIHCSSGSSIMATVQMAVGDATRWIKEAADMGAQTLSLSGGDPLMYPNTDELVAYADLAGFKRILIYTSGIGSLGIPEFMMSYEDPLGSTFGAYQRHNQPVHVVPVDLPDYFFWNLSDRLTNATIVPIFSLHSAYPTIHDYILGVQGAWENAIRLISRLTSSGIDVEVHVVPMAPAIRSEADLDMLRELLSRIGVRKMSLLRFVPQTRGGKNRDILEMPKKLFVRLQHWVENAVNDNHPVEVRVGCPFDYRHSLVDMSTGTEKAKPCHAGHDLILIRPNGDVHPCAAWKTLTHANAHKQTLAEIAMTSPTFVKLREHHSLAAHGYAFPSAEEEDITIASPTCITCLSYTSCAGGCPAQRLHNAGAKWINEIFSGLVDPMCPRINEGYES